MASNYLQLLPRDLRNLLVLKAHTYVDLLPLELRFRLNGMRCWDTHFTRYYEATRDAHGHEWSPARKVVYYPLRQMVIRQPN
jgi:hypothetical protein